MRLKKQRVGGWPDGVDRCEQTCRRCDELGGQRGCVSLAGQACRGNGDFRSCSASRARDKRPAANRHRGTDARDWVHQIRLLALCANRRSRAMSRRRVRQPRWFGRHRLISYKYPQRYIGWLQTHVKGPVDHDLTEIRNSRSSGVACAG